MPNEILQLDGLLETLIYFPLFLLPCLLGIFSREFWSNDIYKKLRREYKHKTPRQLNRRRLLTVFLMTGVLSILALGFSTVFIEEMNSSKALIIGVCTGIFGFSIMEILMNSSKSVMKIILKQAVPIATSATIDAVVDGPKDQNDTKDDETPIDDGEVCANNNEHGEHESCEGCENNPNEQDEESDAE